MTDSAAATLARFQLALLQTAPGTPCRDILAQVLDRVVHLSGSRMGCMHIVGGEPCTDPVGWPAEREPAQALQAVVRAAMDQGSAVTGSGDGFAAAVTVRRAERTVAVLAVGGRDAPFTGDDLDLARVLADLAWEVIQRQRREDALAKETALGQDRQRLIDSLERVVGTGTWSVDHRDGRIDWSAETHRIFGLGHGRFPGTLDAFLDMVHPEDRCAVTSAWTTSLEQRLPYDLTHRIRRPDGTVRHVRESCITDHDRDGRPLRSLGTVQDITDRIAAEEATRKANAELERYFESSMDLLCIAGTDGRFERLNRAWESVLGYRIEDLVGRSYLEFVHPDDRPATVEVGSRLSHGEPVLAFENRYRCRDGSWRWLEWRSQPVGERIYAVARDTTLRRSMEATLADERRRLSLILAGTRAGTWEWNVATGETVVNETWAALVGYTLAELEPVSIATWMRLSHPDDLAESERRLHRHFSGEDPFYDCECRMRHKDGRWVWVHDRGMVVSRAPDGRPLWMMGTHVDISARKEAESALSAAQVRLERQLLDLESMRADLAQRSEQLSEALTMGGMGAWIFDAARGEFRFTDEFFALFRTTARAEGGHWMAPARYADRFIPEPHRGIVAREVAAALTSDDPDYRRSLDHPVVFADGQPGHIQVMLRTQRGPGGRVVRLVGVNQDISERRRQMAELASARDAAERANHAKSRFLATMSHELRTPMNGFMGMLQVLLDTPLDPEQADYARTAYQSAELLLGIINDVLDMSKIDADRMVLESIPVDLAALVESVSAPCRPTAAAAGLRFTAETGPDLPAHILGDPTRLHQILGNLLGNALKFTRHGGIGLRLDRDGDWFVATVSDTGIGIPADRMAVIFDPFIQVDDSTTRRFGGTGLGLSISRRLARLMGGDLVVASSPRGSTFTLSIPLRPAAAPPRRTPAGTPARTRVRSGTRILVAEDDQTGRLVVAAMLDLLGGTAVLVQDGAEAVARAAAESFDLILMDCQMPRMDGFQATAAIRAAEGPSRPRVTIVALTANALPGDRDRCLAAGMDDHLSKPLTIPQLSECLTRWCRTDGSPESPSNA